MTKIDKMLDELDHFWSKIVDGINTGTILNACQRGLLDMKTSWDGKIQRD